MMLRGVGKSKMALVYFLQGLTVVGVISKPANSTLSLANVNYFVRVEGHSVMAACVEPLGCLEEAVRNVVGPQ